MKMNRMSASALKCGAFAVLCMLFASCHMIGEPLFGVRCPDKITLDRSSLTFAEGRTAILSIPEGDDACHVRWSNSDYTVVGLTDFNTHAWVHGRRGGTAIITATLGWGEADSRSPRCTVTVSPVSVHAIDLSPDTLEVVAGNTRIERLIVKITDSVGVEISRYPMTWSSNDSSIATVYWESHGTPHSGHVRGHKEGEVTITASYGSVSGSAIVRVLPDTSQAS